MSTPVKTHLNPDRSPKPGTYRALLIDPPWGLHQKRSGSSKGYAAAEDHYPVMTDGRILGLGDAVQEIAAENSFCFLWVTAATVPFGIQVLAAYGFKYTNFFFWAKPRFTLGQTYRNAGELMLLGVKGKGTKFAFRSQPNWGLYPLQEHSRKPEELHLMIERVVGEGRLLEMFARRPAPTRRALDPENGWDVWGDELPASEPSLISLKKWGYEIPADAEFEAGAAAGAAVETAR